MAKKRSRGVDPVQIQFRQRHMFEPDVVEPGQRAPLRSTPRRDKVKVLGLAVGDVRHETSPCCAAELSIRRRRTYDEDGLGRDQKNGKHLKNESSFSPALWPAYCARIDDRLAELSAGFGDSQLGRAISEAVLARGKRFRGVLLLLTVAPDGVPAPGAVDAAAALELVHAGSLIIDDLPCMDDASMRRGRPATHVVHGQDTAILGGIALVSESLQLLASLSGETPARRAAATVALAEAIGPRGLCLGQHLDLRGEKTRAGIEREQDLKTGALFVATFRIAAILADMDGPAAERMAAIARTLGRAFQCRDDLLDAQLGAADLGKDAGQDAGLRGILAIDSVADARRRYAQLRQQVLTEFSADRRVRGGGRLHPRRPARGTRRRGLTRPRPQPASIVVCRRVREASASSTARPASPALAAPDVPMRVR